MTIVSIDFSILYPGICICKDFKEYQWLAIVNSNQTKKLRSHLDDLVLEYPSIHIAYTESRRRKDEQYHVTERIKLHNYLEATNLLISELKKLVDPTDDLIIAIEGMSFGSKGNALVDIAQATGIIKSKLIESLLNGDNSRMFVFSPGELKNAIGCKGNAPKGDIFNKFKDDPLLDSVKTSDLHKAVLREDWMVTNKGDIVSPIMDMIDGYLGVAKFHQILK
jgi:Holliday junction resolvasome RuvABC endonuclease subunit